MEDLGGKREGNRMPLFPSFAWGSCKFLPELAVS